MSGEEIRPLVAGNWKMNGLTHELGEVRLLSGMLKGVELKCDVMICPPATLLMALEEMAEDADILLGGQDCHMLETGAHTGDISAAMLKDAGASAVIVGHSERRADHGETDAIVMAKARAAQAADLSAIVCVGETLAQRDAGQALDVVGAQLAASLPADADARNTVIAYEPVWAIGTGRTPTTDQVGEVHGHIRAQLTKHLGGDTANRVPILYGGSVKPANAEELMSVPDVNGALVGGASLKAADFIGIIKTFT